MTAAGSGPYLWFLDTLVAVRVSHAEGPDALSLLEHRAPEGHSPPRHIHRTEDELFRVLDGEIRFQMGDDERRLAAGDSLLVPEAIAQLGETAARFGIDVVGPPLR